MEVGQGEKTPRKTKEFPEVGSKPHWASTGVGKLQGKEGVLWVTMGNQWTPAGTNARDYRWNPHPQREGQQKSSP